MEIPLKSSQNNIKEFLKVSNQLVDLRALKSMVISKWVEVSNPINGQILSINNLV